MVIINYTTSIIRNTNIICIIVINYFKGLITLFNYFITNYTIINATTMVEKEFFNVKINVIMIAWFIVVMVITYDTSTCFIDL